MGEPVAVGQVRRKPSGVVVRVVESQLRRLGNTNLADWAWRCAVRNIKTKRVSYPEIGAVLRWPVVAQDGTP